MFGKDDESHVNLSSNREALTFKRFTSKIETVYSVKNENIAFKTPRF